MKRLLLSRHLRGDPPMLAAVLERELADGDAVIVQRLEDALSLRPAASLLAAAAVILDEHAARDELELRDPATGEIAGRVVNIEEAS